MTHNVIDYLENAVQSYPDKIAFADQNNQITFRELQIKAKQIACKISEIANGNVNKPIVIVIDRTVASIEMLFGVIYSGNFYVPVDFQLPINRINTILSSLNTEILIIPPKNVGIVTELQWSGFVIKLDEMDDQVDEKLLLKIKDNHIDTNPLYAIFTSGSTGIPKGVLISHRSVINMVEQFSSIFNFSHQTIFGNQAPFDFDVSVKDIFLTIKNCATTQIIPKMLFSFPIKLIQYLNSKNINTTIWATSALRIVANLKAFEYEKPNYLEKVLFSGEVMPNKVLNYWRRNLPNILYVNLYGPTEITCNCTYYIVKKQFADTDILPIGKPFPNYDVFLLDENNKQITDGLIGEICVRGSSLALGYYNDFEKTSIAFCQNPLNQNYPERIYRTGDLGKYNENGELLFISRKDNQIKHMGHRIELGEIESIVNSLDFIDFGCCLYDTEKELIILYYQADEPSDEKIINSLKNYLPKYMLPNKLINQPKLPLNKNAKIDRKKLMEIYKNGIS